MSILNEIQGQHQPAMLRLVKEMEAVVGRDCHGFWVGYTRVWVWVGFCEPLLNLYPQGGLAGFPRVFHLWRTSTCTANLLLLMNVDQLYSTKTSTKAIKSRI